MSNNTATIKQRVEYYMQHADEYLNTFYCCLDSLSIKRAKDDYIEHCGRLCKCSDVTKQIYKNMYSNVRNELIRDKRNKANNFFLNFIYDSRIKKILNDYGLDVFGNVIHVSNTEKIAEIITSLVIPELEKVLHVKGIKPVKHATINAYSLIDFSHAEIIEE